MKFLETINNTALKVAKGRIAIFTIKVLIVSGIFIFQACTTDSEIEVETTQTENNFLKSLNTSVSNLSNISVSPHEPANYLFNAQTQNQPPSDNGLTTLNLIVNDPNVNIETGLKSLDKLIELNNSGQLQLEVDPLHTEGICNEDGLCVQVDVPTSDAKESLEPLLAESKDLLESYGFTTGEIEEEYGSWDSPQVIFLSLTLFRLEQIRDNSDKTSFNFSPLFIQSSYAENGIGDCALKAIGVDRLVDWAKGKYISGYAARKALIKAVGKAAARIGLGWVGTVWAVASFIECISE